MAKRFVSIWFRYLKTDWYTRRDPDLKNIPFAITAPDHGRMMIIAANSMAVKDGARTGMAVADARAIISGLHVIDDDPLLHTKLLTGIAEWLIRFTPHVAVDGSDGILMDATGCAHLWGGEEEYITAIRNRLSGFGYHVHIAMADTIGTAWAVARYGDQQTVVASRKEGEALRELPAEALRLDNNITLRLHKLGLSFVNQFIKMQRSALRRRFGDIINLRIGQALGSIEENIIPLHPAEPYKEWLPCMDAISSATGIALALQNLLTTLCCRLKKEGKGLRVCMLECFRVDGKTESIAVTTNHPSSSKAHLFKLFENKIDTIEPALGIELFTLQASRIEDECIVQEQLWKNSGSLNDIALAELLDRITCKVGENKVFRYVPAEHYWPERSYKIASLTEKSASWNIDRPRPLHLLQYPAQIEVTAPVPDYPPMLFRYNGVLHKIARADGPERIEQEWWIQSGEHRDYYTVEDDSGKRYWLFRSGHYNAEKTHKWYLHGFFA